MIALTATVCGAGICADLAEFARDREALLRDVPALPGGLPSHDTVSRRFRLPDPEAFAGCLARFPDGLGEAGPGVVPACWPLHRRPAAERLKSGQPDPDQDQPAPGRSPTRRAS